jgi:hypothetical protein
MIDFENNKKKKLILIISDTISNKYDMILKMISYIKSARQTSGNNFGFYALLLLLFFFEQVDQDKITFFDMLFFFSCSLQT